MSCIQEFPELYQINHPKYKSSLNKDSVWEKVLVKLSK